MSDNPAEKTNIEFEVEEDLCCELPQVHHSDPANSSQTEILTVEKAQRMSEFLGFLADTNRLRILSMLADKEMCVFEVIF